MLNAKLKREEWLSKVVRFRFKNKIKKGKVKGLKIFNFFLTTFFITYQFGTF